ncbi:MAG TPA: hypothetical protein PK293_15860, partial [Spirochaetota bacterium]|nr:hypothetical protein [Spirochaetota bacterium]
MKRILLFLFIISLSAAILSCSKKENKELAEQEFKISENASLNQEIKKLKETVKSVQTDVERADIYT